MHAIRSIVHGPFTGWHMLAVMVLFFGTIIGVNATMAYLAGSSWSGLIVKNTYVASQQFDDDVARVEAMKARGWTSAIAVNGASVRYTLANALGTPIVADRVTMAFSRPAGEDQDRLIVLRAQEDGSYRAGHELGAGQWLVKATATKNGAVVYTDVQRIVISTERSR
ncbi:FixH family protein [Nitratireductor sp. XY-223]|uniref:FixH family protein n=1 Tax=Nitratireductor sp. XY-223 TaxID=2561926 RepID=UPI0010A9B982|nr:FixH family protein [Nitratireductor sp. XY-223]